MSSIRIAQSILLSVSLLFFSCEKKCDFKCISVLSIDDIINFPKDSLVQYGRAKSFKHVFIPQLNIECKDSVVAGYYNFNLVNLTAYKNDSVEIFHRLENFKLEHTTYAIKKYDSINEKYIKYLSISFSFSDSICYVYSKRKYYVFSLDEFYKFIELDDIKVIQHFFNLDMRNVQEVFSGYNAIEQSEINLMRRAP